MTNCHIDELISALEVRFVQLSERLVSCERRLEMTGLDEPGLHYNLVGEGSMSVCGGPAFQLRPHMLIIVPPASPFWVEVPGGSVNLLCGLFRAAFGLSTHLFQELREPIVEHFCAEDCIHHKLEAALAEVTGGQIGAGAMSGALLKQVIVQLVRRSLGSSALWAKRFGLLRDPQIARAFGAMAANPGGMHTVQSLAKAASLGRSAFMARFVEIVGQTPMTVLRDLRMHQAASYLETTDLTVDQIADSVGYASRSSFVRAFRRSYGIEPSELRVSRRAS